MTETLVGQLPKHIGSTGGLLNSAETEEKYAIVWKSSKEQAFELPTGGAAIMHEGDNLMYFARKEQCLALGTQLRAFKPRIEDFKIYRKFSTLFNIWQIHFSFILNLKSGKILSNLRHAFL